LERRVAMMKVSAVRAVKNEGTENYILILINQPQRRLLPIWVGPQEGEQILLQLRQIATTRPATFRFVADLLAKSDVKVQEVRISTLKDDLFYATVLTHTSKGVQETDARPSDAIALALHAGNPIYIDEEVMAKAGRDLPEAFDSSTWERTAVSAEEMER